MRFNNPSDLLRRSKRTVRLMFQMMAGNLHFDEERLVLDRAAGSGWEWPVGSDGREIRWSNTLFGWQDWRVFEGIFFLMQRCAATVCCSFYFQWDVDGLFRRFGTFAFALCTLPCGSCCVLLWNMMLSKHIMQKPILWVERCSEMSRHLSHFNVTLMKK